MKILEKEKRKQKMTTVTNIVKRKNNKEWEQENELKNERKKQIKTNVDNKMVKKKIKKKTNKKNEIENISKEKKRNKVSKKTIEKDYLESKEDKKQDKIKEKVLNKNTKLEKDSIRNKSSIIDTECLWTDLFLSKPLIKSLFELKFEHPTLVQKDVIPIALEGKSILANSETGSGKTLAFVLPILERMLQSPNIKMRTTNAKSMNITKSLILLPTRELALQCHDVVKSLTKYVPITYSLFCGGFDLKQQEVEYKKKNDIFICTPGRILDLLLNSANDFIDFLEIVVFDEADKLLELGFKEECLKILDLCKFKKQILFFSATLTKDIKELAHFSLKNPIYIQSGQNRVVDKEDENEENSNNKNNKILKTFKIAENLNQEFVNIMQEKNRKAVLLYLCNNVFKNHTIIFFKTRKEAHYMYLVLSFLKFKCAELHGGLTQKKRIENICQFKKEEVDFLLATELASRGIDIEHIQYVINYNVPTSVVRYVHRIGRTARIGKEGTACTLYLPCEKEHVKKMIKSLKKNESSKIFKRTVSKEHVVYWEKLLKKHVQEIKDLVEQEITEREIMKSEKSIDKIKNIIMYKDEIMSRPKRTWFLTSSEKLALKRSSKENEILKDGIVKNTNEKELDSKQLKNSKFHEKKKKKKNTNGNKGNSDYSDNSSGSKEDAKEKIKNLKAIMKDLRINVLHGDNKKFRSNSKKTKNSVLRENNQIASKKEMLETKKQMKQRRKPSEKWKRGIKGGKKQI